MNTKVNVTVLSGGHGAELARALKHLLGPRLSLIMTAFDNGGHSGRLMKRFDIPAPGDYRRGLLAMADREKVDPDALQLLGYRLPDDTIGDDLTAASMGNLMILSFLKMHGNIPDGLSALCRMYHVVGKLYPISIVPSTLVATLSDGRKIHGEELIDKRHKGDTTPIAWMNLDPMVPIYHKSEKAIESSDILALSYGDMYTSVGQTLLPAGTSEAIVRSKARLVLVVNAMTKRGETDGYTTATFVERYNQYLPYRIDAAICHDWVRYPAPPHILAKYAAEGAFPVRVEESKNVRAWAKGNFITWSGGTIKHTDAAAQRILEV